MAAIAAEAQPDEPERNTGRDCMEDHILPCKLFSCLCSFRPMSLPRCSLDDLQNQTNVMTGMGTDPVMYSYKMKFIITNIKGEKFRILVVDSLSD